MREEVGIPPEQVEPLRLGYWETYGVTLGGLMAEHGVDPEHYLAYVHDVPLGDYLSPDPALGEAIRSLPGRKVIFTNATVEHAQKVMDELGLERFCCKSMFLGQTDLIELVGRFKKA